MFCSRSGRSAMMGLLALTAAACTRQTGAGEQGNGQANGQVDGQLNAAAIAPDEAAPAAATPKAGVVDRSHRGEKPQAAKLTGLDGTPASLDGFRGKPLLVNLWATWCAPCVAEMPTLDTVAARVATVVLNQGEDAAKVQPFLTKARLTHVRPLLDPGMAVSLGLGTNLPTTILYDAAGKEVWRVAGGRDWTSAESAKLISEAG